MILNHLKLIEFFFVTFYLFLLASYKCFANMVSAFLRNSGSTTTNLIPFLKINFTRQSLVKFYKDKVNLFLMPRIAVEIHVEILPDPVLSLI